MNPDLESFIKIALAEDVGGGDHSSLACIPADAMGKANLLIKENGILAGMGFAEFAFNYIDSSLEFIPFKTEGEAVQKGDVAFRVEGKIQAILMLERLVLNCMQRMSGVATKTNTLVQKI